MYGRGMSEKKDTDRHKSTVVKHCKTLNTKRLKICNIIFFKSELPLC